MNRFLLFYWIVLPVPFQSALGSGYEDQDNLRQIQRLFSDRCYQCHGPDEETRAADLRLDKREGALSVLEVGDPDTSELFRRITTDDGAEKMPPAEAKLELSSDEIQMIRDWIQNGARWQSHWAFQPLADEVPVPDVNSEWPNNEIDNFVLAKMQSQGLRHQSTAEKWQWLRRVTFDLTGLPPSIEELDEFTNDQHPQAHERVVDRLLNSKAFGEHMAVAWLDAARYGDSYGYQSDMLNTQWPYRDWVVRAFNENLSYDKFLVWQLAGDYLAESSGVEAEDSQEQKLATAFNRLHRMNNEGGAVFKEWKTENIADRVNTYGTAILGLTVECARCHDHKFDPISQRDYYSLFAFFNSIDENGLYDKTAKVPSPTMLLPNIDQAKRIRDSQSQMQKALGELASENIEARQRWLVYQAKMEGNERLADEKFPMATPIASNDFDQIHVRQEKEEYYPSTDDRGRAQDPPRIAVEDCEIPNIAIESKPRLAAQLNGDVGFTIPGITSFDRWTPFSLAMTIKDTQRSELRSVLAHHSRGTDAGYNGWDLTIIDGFVEARLYRVWPGNAIAVRAKEQIPGNQWVHLTVTFDGLSRASGFKLYVDGKLQEVETLRDKSLKSANVAAGHGGQLVLGQRFRSKGFTGGLIDQFQLYDKELSDAEVEFIATGNPLTPTLDYFTKRIDQQAGEIANGSPRVGAEVRCCRGSML